MTGGSPDARAVHQAQLRRCFRGAARVGGELVGQGTFRAALYYRFNVIPIRNSPLRERGTRGVNQVTFLVCIAV